jgi:putative ABC transport system permease protein
MMNVISRDVKQEFYRELHGRIATLPGVESVSVASGAPLSGYYGTANVGIEGGPTDAMFADFHMVSHDYFRTLRINVLTGRSFTERDRNGAKRVAIIKQAAAQQFFGGEDPLGNRLSSGFAADYPNAEPLVEFVGIVDVVKYGRIEEDTKPGIYLSAWQPIGPPSLLIVRAQGDIATLVAAVRREVRALDKNMPVYGVKTMTERAAEVTSRTRFIALLLGLFAGLALILSATGIYGVMAYAVSARTQEIGIRIALGAQTGDVLGLVLRQGFVLTLIGLVMGLAGSYAASRALTSQLYGVGATDPVTFGLVTLLLVAVALLACYIPARRAIKVDPMVALRCE